MGSIAVDKASAVQLESSTTNKRKHCEDHCLRNLPRVAVPERTDFEPSVHLQFEQPSKIYTMEDLGLPEETGVSPVAVSEPFQLFTAEAIEQMRAEILSKPVWENCQYSSNLSQCQLRGFAPE